MKGFTDSSREYGIGILPMTSRKHRQDADATFCSTLSSAFSLVEVIIALGVFVFSITVLLGMLPVGLKSVRSVQNEGNAVHIASSIFGLWQMAPSGSELTVPGAFSNLGSVGTATGSGTTYYFDEYGSRASSSDIASVAMVYSAVNTGSPATWEVSLEFHWPAQGNSTNTASGVQSRRFIQNFVK